MKYVRYKPAVGRETILFTIIFFGIFISIGSVMGTVNMLSTIMATAYDLLINTVFYIMAISVVTGALSSLFSEFGFVSLIDLVLSKVIKPIYDMPGASSLGILNCYMSDNPAILTLAKEDNFKRYFKQYQLPALTNIGTSFGMGLIVTATMIGLPIDGAVQSALIGNLGAVVGSVVSVRMMLFFTKRLYGTEADVTTKQSKEIPPHLRVIREGGTGSRLLSSLLEGGMNGVEMGMAIIPGVLVVCTMVMLLTNGPGPGGLYDGGLGQGVAFLPWLGEKFSFILVPLFGFSNPEAIAVPITALGAAGAAVGVAADFVTKGLADGNDLAVFTAMCMCWSGYLSTHIAMMDALGTKEATGYALISHTIGGLVAGVAAHFIYILV
ncbi:hypothetical protein AWM75_01810 [Aerococcus urinaehominis]|uniref:Uncharacterized protein n=1 Tax=Aerococcus urinaehominis TaxID=128944 RepID=A0A0X8FK67_9LACT|nr:hypothetical protein [Aerococcus urinaehominis]AMB98804.1 hypothetical protein AWM75_01810 [Aerococcus urinaehominis]SDM49703.1 hypothetical protein SAMN04487985_11930 [Aerococcus urinaehominis]